MVVNTVVVKVLGRGAKANEKKKKKTSRMAKEWDALSDF